MIPVIIINHCVIDYARQNYHIFINGFALFNLIHSVYTFMKYLYKSFDGREAYKVKNNGIVFKAKNLMLHEKWALGTPPIGQTVDASIIISAHPAYFKTLSDNGYKANGIGIIYDYPGGALAYFNQIVKPIIDAYAASLTFNPLTFTGQLCIDIEEAYPATNDILLEWDVGATNFVNYMQTKHNVNRLNAIKIYNGICAQYYPILIKYLRDKFPKAKVGWYGTPYVGPHSTWYANSEKIPAIIDLCENELAWLWKHLDMLCPGLYMYYDLEETWEVPGNTSYQDYVDARKKYFEYVVTLKNKFKLSVYPTISPVYDNTAMSMGGKALENDDWLMVDQMLRYCEADGAIIWCNCVDDTSAANINAGLLAGAQILNEFRMS